MLGLGLALPLLAVANSVIVFANVVPGAFIFEFSENEDRAPALESVRKNGNVRMDLDFHLFKGVSVQLHDLEKADTLVDQLARMPGVKRWWPVTLHQVPDVELHWNGNPSTENSLQARDDSNRAPFSSHVMTQVDKLHAKGFNGTGVNVAIIDTGVDYKHPSLGGCFGKGCLVQNGYDFVGNNFTGTNSPVPGNDPMDCTGHGTHVAGIVAANDKKLGFVGGAPGVTLNAYRVFGCKGSATSDVLIAALNRAHQDGAHIISVSIGGPNGWKENSWALAASRIVAKGTVVVMSAGNEGAKGVFYGTSGGVGAGVSAVASFANVVSPVLMHYGNVTVDNGKPQQFTYALGTPDRFDSSLPLWVSTFNTSAEANLCSRLPESTPDLSNYTVLIRFGGCAPDHQANNAAKAGAKHILFYHNTDEHPLYINIQSRISKHVRGLGFVHKKLGEEWIKNLAAGKNVTIKLGSKADEKFELDNFPNNQTGGALNTFTSWGPTWTMDVKPQFGAPGGQILSTWPREKGSYAVTSGTSMAAPITASMYALLMQIRGRNSPGMLQSLLSANANPQLFHDGDRFLGQLAPVPQQGGGIVQVYDAAFATTLLEPSSLSFNETSYFAKSKNFTLTNQNNRSITYQFSYVPALTTFTLTKNGNLSVNPFPGVFSIDSATLRFSDDSITIEKGQSATVEVIATPPNLDANRLPLWSGYIRVNGTDGSSLSLPYLGLLGSLRNHTVLDPKGSYIANAGDKDMKPVASNTVFTVPRPGRSGNSTMPAIVFTPFLGIRELQFHAIPASGNGTAAKPIGQLQGSPGNYTSRAKDSLRWNGQLNDGHFAPEGTYKVVVKALRLWGDAANKMDWDETVTPPFVLKYA